MHSSGWYQIAYERDLGGEITPASIGGMPLVVVRTADGLRAFDATCPHRGAHLGYGGCLEGDAIVCPFHGERIALGLSSNGGFHVREYRTLVVGGLVFVLLDDEHELGFTGAMRAFDATHYYVPGFELRVAAPADLVIENGFDNAHFRSVHGILNEPDFTTETGTAGELIVRGMFEIPPSPWQRGAKSGRTLLVPFTARAYSPNVLVSEMGGDYPYLVITTATPVESGGCLIRLSLAVPPGPEGKPPGEDLCRYLLQQSKGGIEKDRVIWEHMTPGARSRFTALDGAVIEFRKFCRRFRAGVVHDYSHDEQ